MLSFEIGGWKFRYLTRITCRSEEYGFIILLIVFWYLCFSYFQKKYLLLLVPGRPRWMTWAALVLVSQWCWATLDLCEPKFGLSRSTMWKWVCGKTDNGGCPKQIHFLWHVFPSFPLLIPQHASAGVDCCSITRFSGEEKFLVWPGYLNKITRFYTYLGI